MLPCSGHMIVDFSNYDGNSGLKPDMITQYLEESLEERDDQTVVAAGRTLQDNAPGLTSETGLGHKNLRLTSETGPGDNPSPA